MRYSRAARASARTGRCTCHAKITATTIAPISVNAEKPMKWLSGGMKPGITIQYDAFCLRTHTSLLSGSTTTWLPAPSRGRSVSSSGPNVSAQGAGQPAATACSTPT
jgi:hypothetical protein